MRRQNIAIIESNTDAKSHSLQLKKYSKLEMNMRHTENYLVLLVFLFISIILAMSIRDIVLVKIIGLLIIFGLCLAAYLITRRRRDQFILIPLGLLALSVYMVMETCHPAYLFIEILDRLLWIGFAIYLSLLVCRQIFSTASVNPQEICGAISVYLLIGVIFAQIYEILLILNPKAISFNPNNFEHGVLHNGDMIYFSFVTLATVGYGDITPASPAGRAICVAEAIFGIMFVAIFIARFVSAGSKRHKKAE
jgi:voltage-gated potassium channel